MITQEEQLLTNKKMYGKWYGKDEVSPGNVLEYNLNVGKEMTHFTIIKNGETIKTDEFESSGLHWMDRYLYYTDTGKYFIEKATDTEIVFGELTSLGLFDGKYEVHEVLKRIG